MVPIREKGIKKIRKAANCTEFCIPVLFSAFVNASEIKICTSFESHFCGNIIDSWVFLTEQVDFCRKQARVQKHFTAMTTVVDGGITIPNYFFPELINEEQKKRILMSLTWFYKTNITTIHEEKLVYGPKDLLAWLGGALGIFVGYSFFDFAKHIIDIVFHFIYKVLKNHE